MKSANKEKLLSYFQNNYQYRIPFFQRAYVWDEENWDLLIEHVQDEVDAHKNQENSEHFIGTIITKSVAQSNMKINGFELVDGQQRLTTISIMLKALADTNQGKYPQLKTNLLGYLIFVDSLGKEHLRIQHSKNDEPHFKEVMRKVEEPSKIAKTNNQINQAYHYFADRYVSLSDEDRDVYTQVLLNKLPVIAMFLDPMDDEQEIFDTINSLGVRLTTAELLKNFVFREDKLKPFYEELWFDQFEKDETELEFWNSLKTSGRVKRTNLELLLYCFLIIETGSEVRIDKLFVSYKKYLKEMSVDDKKDVLERLKAYTKIYRQFPSNQELKEIKFDEIEKRVFHVIEYLEITTVYPFLLFLYMTFDGEDDRNAGLKIMESYLVRRLIAKLTTKNYNRFFIQLINDLKSKDELSIADIATTLANFQEDTNKWPNDDMVKYGFLNNYLYNKYTREILFIITLYTFQNKLADASAKSVDSYSVEHMMPKKWREHWSISGMSEEDKSQRDRILKTLGNLTLVTQPLNSKMKNNSWAKKKLHLKKHSSLSITKDYLENQHWNENTISKRGENLVQIALKVWRK